MTSPHDHPGFLITRFSVFGRQAPVSYKERMLVLVQVGEDFTSVATARGVRLIKLVIR